MTSQNHLVYSCHSFFSVTCPATISNFLWWSCLPTAASEKRLSVHPATQAKWVTGRQLQSCPQKPGHSRICTTWDARDLIWWLLQHWHWAQGTRLPGEPPDSAPGMILTWTEVCADVIRWKSYLGFPRGPWSQSQVSFEGSQRAMWQAEGEKAGTRESVAEVTATVKDCQQPQRECRPTDTLIWARWYWRLTAASKTVWKQLCCLKPPTVC